MAAVSSRLKSAVRTNRRTPPPPPKRYSREEKYGAAPIIPPIRKATTSFLSKGGIRFTMPKIPIRVGLQGSDIPEGLGLPPRSGFPWPGQYDPEGLGLSGRTPWVQEEKRFIDWRNEYIQSQQGGDGGGGGYVPPPPPAATEEGPVTWTEGGFEAAGGNAPAWWRAMTPDTYNESSLYAMMTNALIPYLSSEDQVRAAHSLYVLDPEGFSRYKPQAIPEVTTVSEDVARYLERKGRPLPGDHPIGVSSTGIERQTQVASDENARYLQSAQRALDAITTLSRMREATVQGNRWKLGPGYVWLQDMLGSMAGSGATGGQGQTRGGYLAMLGKVDPLMGQAKSSDLSAFGALGQMLYSPFATGRELMPTREVGGRRLFGVPNPAFT